MASESAKRRKKRRSRDAARRTGAGPDGAAGPGESRAGAGSGVGRSESRGAARRPRPSAGEHPTARRRAGRGGEEGPPAPWGSFPLIELAVLVGIVMLILGFFFVDGPRRSVLIVAGLSLGSIGGLELSIREHFAGYRSHTFVLAGVPALAVLALLFYAGPDGLPQLVRLAIALAVLAGAAVLLSGAFARRSGGARFRFSSWREWFGRP